MESQSQNANMKDSISDLSNMVFGVALSIGALILINNISGSTTSVSVIVSLTTFAFSFLLIIYIWFRYVKAIELMYIRTGMEVTLNVLILFLVVIEPYLFYLLHTSSLSLLNTASTLFALDFAALLLVLYIFYKIGIDACKKAGRKISTYYRSMTDSLLISGIFFGISALPVFFNINLFGTELRFLMWFAAIPLGVALRHISRYLRKVNVL